MISSIAVMMLLGVLKADIDPWSDTPGMRAVYAMFSLLFLLQSVASALALVAIPQQSVSPEGR
jgi:hypothetical protein